MEWKNINENVKDDTNIVETEELFIYNVTIKHGNVDSLMKENSQKKEELLIVKNIHIRLADNDLGGNANCVII